jgi:hypothetical protein
MELCGTMEPRKKPAITSFLYIREQQVLGSNPSAGE